MLSEEARNRRLMVNYRARRNLRKQKYGRYSTPEYSEYSVSTPSVPPRVQVPHVHLRYCGVLRGTHRDEDRREHRRPSRGREERVRRERAVEVALDRLDGLQKVSAACCNADRAPALPAVPSGCQVCAGRDPARCSHQACKPAGGGLSPAGSYVRSD